MNRGDEKEIHQKQEVHDIVKCDVLYPNTDLFC